MAAQEPGIDPVGACVGQRGTRVQSIVNELNGEKIDVIEWSQDPTVVITKALGPAKVLAVHPPLILGERCRRDALVELVGVVKAVVEDPIEVTERRRRGGAHQPQPHVG